MRASLIAGALAAVVALGACKNSKPLAATTGPTAADSAEQVFVVAHSILTTKGVQRGDLTADTAYVLDESTRFDLRVAHVNFTSETGAPQGTMDAKRGVYSTRTQVLEGWGNVVVKLVDGRTLKSPHVVYNQITHLISSDTTYTIQRGSDTQSGVGFNSNQTFTQFKCLKACTGNSSVLLPER
jgi:LPS export ABC transporter protein LptC